MSTPPNTDQTDRLAWFAGNSDALELYNRLVFVAHTWDDLVDRDKPVPEAVIHSMMANLLIYLPTNKAYRQFEAEIRGLLLVGIVGYMAANQLEREKTDHGLELAHYLRYSVMGVGVFLIGVLNGTERGAQILAQAAPVMVPERLAAYLQEHQA